MVAKNINLAISHATASVFRKPVLTLHMCKIIYSGHGVPFLGSIVVAIAWVAKICHVFFSARVASTIPQICFTLRAHAARLLALSSCLKMLYLFDMVLLANN